MSTVPSAAWTVHDFQLLDSDEPLAVELAASFLAEESARGAAAAVRYLNADPRVHETWLGGALIGLRREDGSPAAGGAYRRYDSTTVELAQLWTHPALRRRGLARQVIGRLEEKAERTGYLRVYATAEPGQEALWHLLQASGYTALGECRLDYPGFVKALPKRRRDRPRKDAR
jgi:polar amino acid transport system permease protein